ncbi:MAG: FAD-binding oxidoreductase [Flavisolibacter sp.]
MDQSTEEIVKIITIEKCTHDVKQFRIEKPAGYQFGPGQATEVSINKEGWREERRPFTFTSLNESPYLEFTIKIYRDHPGVTNELDKLVPGDELVIRDVWGAIEYKGPGYFIAGGAGITPFLAILRWLKKEDRLQGNQLFFSNKTARDVILEDELRSMLGGDAVFVVTDEKSPRHYNGFIDRDFLAEHVKDFSRHFYLCGPPGMVEALQQTLKALGASPDAVVFEK